VEATATTGPSAANASVNAERVTANSTSETTSGAIVATRGSRCDGGSSGGRGDVTTRLGAAGGGPSITPQPKHATVGARASYPQAKPFARPREENRAALADDEELLADVDASPSNDAVALARDEPTRR
jgi:hypothetical protein